MLQYTFEPIPSVGLKQINFTKHPVFDDSGFVATDRNDYSILISSAVYIPGSSIE